jgi:hypothetical protein
VETAAALPDRSDLFAFIALSGVGEDSVGMTLVRFGSRAVGRRLAVIDGYEFPSSVRSRFSLQHQALSAEDVRVVEAATRQWFRLVARHPKAKLAMPSVIVDDMWHEFVLHTRDYAELCESAFVRFLHHTPESAMSAEGASVNRTAGIAMTYRLARQDEPDESGRLPLLFRADAELGISGGRRYLADCGGRGQCHDLPGALCLQHIDGLERGFGGRWKLGSQHGNYPIDGGGGGVGCAGGCGGG